MKYTQPYTKNRQDANLHLNYDSNHPRHQKDNIPYSQALRIRKICSEEEEHMKHSKNLGTFLNCRGYPPILVNNANIKAKINERIILLHMTTL